MFAHSSPITLKMSKCQLLQQFYLLQNTKKTIPYILWNFGYGHISKHPHTPLKKKHTHIRFLRRFHPKNPSLRTKNHPISAPSTISPGNPGPVSFRKEGNWNSILCTTSGGRVSFTPVSRKTPCWTFRVSAHLENGGGTTTPMSLRWKSMAKSAPKIATEELGKLPSYSDLSDLYI